MSDSGPVGRALVGARVGGRHSLSMTAVCAEPTVVCEHVFDEALQPTTADGDDPARRPRLVLRLGRAARRSAAAQPAGDRRRRDRARRQLRGQAASACTHPMPEFKARRLCPDWWSCRPGSRPTPRPARRCSRCSTTPRRSSRGCRSTRPSSTSAVCGGSPGEPVDIARRLRARSPRAGRPADHGRRGAYEVPGQGGERCRQAGRIAAGRARSRARLPASAPGREACGVSVRSPSASSTTAASAPWVRWRARQRRSWSRSSASRPGGSCMALSHNRDPRRGRAPVVVADRSDHNRRSGAVRSRPRRSSRCCSASSIV